MRETKFAVDEIYLHLNADLPIAIVTGKQYFGLPEKWRDMKAENDVPELSYR